MIINPVEGVEVADQYKRSAEFVDVMIASHWAALAPPLSQALRGVTGPIVDVGAGGGQGTRVIAEAVPEAEIVAVEPSAALPQKLGAVVAMNVIGHFDPAGRQRIWSLLTERLVPGGRAVLNLQPPTEPMTVPESRFADVRVGRRGYEGWGRAEPAGPDRITWRMAYHTYHDDQLVDELEVAYAWWVLDERQLRAELGGHGLAPAPTGPAGLGMYLIDRAGA
jgi:hypothetical protein